MSSKITDLIEFKFKAYLFSMLKTEMDGAIGQSERTWVHFRRATYTDEMKQYYHKWLRLV